MVTKRVINNSILKEIQDAEVYYIASTVDKLMPPIKLGGRWELMKLTEVLKESDLVFQYGIYLELYIFLSLSEKEIKKLIESTK